MAAAAEKLHLDIKIIEALEADRFAELGASVYVRGHLRRYADFVGEPGVELVQAYSAREAQPPPPDLTQFPQAERRSDPRRLITPLVGLGCALVLALAIWWVLAGPRFAASHPSVAAAPGDAAPAPATGPAPDPAAPAAAMHVAGATPLAPAVAPGTVAPADATPQKREEAAPARTTRLRLELNSESWVEVYDSRGARLFYDVASAGSVQSHRRAPAAARGARQRGRGRRADRRPAARNSRQRRERRGREFRGQSLRHAVARAPMTD